MEGKREEENEEGRKRGGEGGRRGRRMEDAPLSAAAARPRLGGPGESGGPRREGGRRRAGGDSQTPVSLAAAERALPRPTHCGRRVLYNSAVSHRGRDSPAGPGRSPSPSDPSWGWEWGWGLRSEAEGRALRPALCRWQLRARPARPVRVRGDGVRCCLTEPRGGATPTAAARFSSGKGWRRSQSLRKKPRSPRRAGSRTGGVGWAWDWGLSGL